MMFMGMGIWLVVLLFLALVFLPVLVAVIVLWQGDRTRQAAPRDGEDSTLT